MAPSIQLVDLPKEILDNIFQHLHGEYKALNVLLLNRSTNSSAMIALWHHVDLSIRQPYKDHRVVNAHRAVIKKKAFEMLFSIPVLNPSGIRSLRFDIPHLDCDRDCQPLILRDFAHQLGTHFPKLSALDITFLREQTRTSHQCWGHSKINLPSTVRSLTTNRPDLFEWSDEAITAGTSLDILTFSSICAGHAHNILFKNWRRTFSQAGTSNSIAANIKAFRYQNTSPQPCGECRSYERYWEGLLLDSLLKDVIAHSAKNTLERLEVEASLDYGTKDMIAPDFLGTVGAFPNLRNFQMPIDLASFAFTDCFTSDDNISFEVVVDPRPLALAAHPHTETHELHQYVQALAHVKTFLDLSQDDKRRIDIIFKGYPRSASRKEDYRARRYLHGAQTLRTWLNQQMRAVGMMQLRSWLQHAPAYVLVPTLLLPQGYAHISASMDALETWASAHSASSRRRRHKGARRR